MVISQRHSSNYGNRCGWVPDVIVCHITDGGFEGAVETLCGADGGSLSAHFVVGRNGQVAQLVDIRKEAYCNGTQSGSPSGYEYVGRATAALVKNRRVNANLYTISIECEGTDATHGILTDAQFSALVELIKYIRQQVKEIYGIDIPADRTHLIGHCEIAPREKPDCPGRSFPWDKLIAALTGKSASRLSAVTHIDMPGSGSLVPHGPFGIGGWAVNPAGVVRVDVYADTGVQEKQLLGQVPLRIERPDVDAAYPGYNKQPRGWQLVVPAGKLSPGTHTIDAAAIGNDKSVCWAHVKITAE